MMRGPCPGGGFTNIALVTPAGGRTPGVRVRKIHRTRRALINAAVDLCLTRGYANTTIDHIAAAADVSTRTFSRYFTSKDAVFVAVLDDLAEEIAIELRAQPADLGPLEAMRTALRTVLDVAQNARFHSGTADYVARIIKVVTASDTLRQAAIDYRAQTVLEAMARRMNVDADDRQLGLAMTIISVTVVHAWSVLATSDLPLQPRHIANGIDQTFADLATSTAGLAPNNRPDPRSFS